MRTRRQARKCARFSVESDRARFRRRDSGSTAPSLDRGLFVVRRGSRWRVLQRRSLLAGRRGNHIPRRALRPCGRPGCPNLASGRYCQADEHLAKQWDQQRGSAASRGYDSKWDRARKAKLAKDPWCAECARQGIRTPATMVDHRVPHRGDMKLFWNSSNWQSLDDHCHAVKRQRESMEARG